MEDLPNQVFSVSMGSQSRASRQSGRISASSGKDSGFSNLSNIRCLKNPLKVSGSGVSAKEAIELCQKAYQHVPIFKNTIEIMTEFSNAPLHFKGDDETSVEFFTNWYKKINSYDIADQFFREMNRSSNIFLYRMNYSFSSKDIKTPSDNFLIGKEIPIRYALLDPCSIKCDGGSTFLNSSYSKILNKYELDRLRSSKDEEDLRILRTFSPKDQEKIKKGNGDIAISLDREKLIPVFFKKQDYEALSVPFFFPVLADINLKLEFKKADLAISKTTDYLILLITMGAKKDDGGTDPRMLEATSQLFENESVGRVMVADYTTKGEFLIPDLNKILGKGKYEAVDKDIAQGMMNIFFESDQKFSNSIIKVKLFLERLEEARRIFRDRFLIPEMERIAETLKLKEVPIPVFEKIDLEDRSQLLRVYTRLAEIGFLTPDEFFEISESGLFPTEESSLESQRKLKSFRDNGLYSPLMGGSGEAGRPEGTSSPKAPNSTNNPSSNVSIKESQRKAEAYKFSSIKQTHEEICELIPKVEAEFKKKFSIQRLSQSKKDQAFGFVESIVISEPKNKWEKSINKYLEGHPVLPDDRVLEISEEHNLPFFQAAILKHSCN